MLYLRCTRKLLDPLTRYGGNRAEEPPEIPVLREWYGNLFRIERRNCALFVHSTTLFAFVVCGLTRPDFSSIDTTFRNALLEQLFYERIDLNVIEKIMPSGTPVGLLSTKSRSVLGSMNDFVVQAVDQIERSGGLATSSLRAVGYNLNECPMGAIGYQHPVDAFKQLLAAPEG